ncbi:MAG TPA: exodeoxyribonuclease VII small subunit [Candidatus Paraprevotella stercorigallinarum]|jgi:exodeoxyribonuclease VII small subunit|nr:exodeoxyribonuclease VII small subunit [Candidatus Paraprevotella stercorigallinarum]
MKKSTLTYEEAMSQLEELVRQVENNEQGIDKLADQLKKAQQLIAFCKDKLYATDEEIQKILKNGEKE